MHIIEKPTENCDYCTITMIYLLPYFVILFVFEINIYRLYIHISNQNVANLWSYISYGNTTQIAMYAIERVSRQVQKYLIPFRSNFIANAYESSDTSSPIIIAK